MSARGRNGVRGARRAGVLAAALLLAAPAAQAAPPLTLALGLSGGAALPDAHLADYAWDTRARGEWGALAYCARGPWRAGVRAQGWTTTQRLDLPGGAIAPRVRSLTLALELRRAFARTLGARWSVTGDAGRRALAWTPGRASVDAGGTPVTVTFAPISTWTAGGGVAVERAFGARWSVGLVADRQFFALDTAHRAGASVVDARESFGDWNARVELARVFALGREGASR